MSPMFKIRWDRFIFVFFLCFFSFLGGWLTAVFIVPGHLSARDSLSESPSSPPKGSQVKKEKSDPFLKEMARHILILFDPYKMDSFMKENTRLKDEDFFIKTEVPQETTENINFSSTEDTNPASKEPEKDVEESVEEEIPPGLTEWELKRIQAEEEISKALKEVQEDYDKKNREQFLKISKTQDFFTLDGKFSFLVNVFSEQEPAFKYVKSMKEIYPSWSFLLKAHRDHVRIYLGPFPSEKKAMQFKESLPLPSPFSQLFLEEISL